MAIKKKKKLSSWQYLALGFVIAILIGTGLLCLPFATKSGETSLINAFFTSTSATCVTGLVAYDTNTHWTLFGQIVILCLIQLGGLGIMTFVTIVVQAFGKNLKLRERKILMISTGEEKQNELSRLFRRLLLGTLLFEGVGVMLLSIRFIPEFGWGKGIYYSIFHSVSAFCNAGFDLMGGLHGNGKFASLVHYATDPLVSLTIAGLIIIGGVGFCVWDDILEGKGRWKKLRLHSKIVICTTAALLLSSTFLFLLFEWNNPTLQTYNFAEKLLVSFFSATTPRTAGFNTLDLTSISDAGFLLTIILMFIGGSTASTAGGIKVTTFSVIIMGMISVFRGKRDIEIGKRRIHNALLRQALAVFVACLFILLVATIAICCIEQSNPETNFPAILFECTSALGTVGLTKGITPFLTVASKIILMFLMYTGRVGILTLALAFAESNQETIVKKPVEDVLIG